MIVQSIFPLWLTSQVSNSMDKRYRHQLILEDCQLHDQGLAQLRAYVQRAHDDARDHLRALAGISLDPFGDSPNKFDPAEGYPELLDEVTLKGYLGEVLTALIVEYFAPFDEQGWTVPAFLFRFHRIAFDKLEELRAGQPATAIPGRTGNDCLAFQFDEQGFVLRVLVCEAKCTAQHDSTMLSHAHQQVSTVGIPSVRELIDILLESNDSCKLAWADGLRQVWIEGASSNKYERYDLVSYVHGQRPIRRATWSPVDQPHPSYHGNRRLETVEVYLDNIDTLIHEVYR